MNSQFVLTCGACSTSHVLERDAAVVAAEIATFVAAHRDHGDFRIRSETGPADVEAAE